MTSKFGFYSEGNGGSGSGLEEGGSQLHLQTRAYSHFSGALGAFRVTRQVKTGKLIISRSQAIVLYSIRNGESKGVWAGKWHSQLLGTCSMKGTRQHNSCINLNDFPAFGKFTVQWEGKARAHFSKNETESDESQMSPWEMGQIRTAVGRKAKAWGPGWMAHNSAPDHRFLSRSLNTNWR